MTNAALVWLYRVNTALLVTHEIDSAYWKEWDLFGIPGGLPGFLALHVPLLLVILWGHEQLVLSRRAGAWISLALAGGGAFALIAHGAFLLAGRSEFRTVASLALLGAIGGASVGQAFVAVAVLRGAPGRHGGMAHG